LPAGGIQAVEATDGQLLFISDTGRYVVRGNVYDLWHGVALTSLAQAEELAGRIDLKHLKLDVADLGALDLGTGPDVVAFVDPQCLHYAAFFKDLALLTDRYRFRLIPLPIAEDSQSAVLVVHCLATTDRAAALAALLEHQTDVPAATGTCGQPTAQRTLITAQLFGVRGTPSL
jgi:thiol:disulfide interchange protein DsbC